VVAFKRTADGEEILTSHSTEFYQKEEGEETGVPSASDMKLFIVTHAGNAETIKTAELDEETPEEIEGEGGEHTEL
jgi:hypothetical protein